MPLADACPVAMIVTRDRKVAERFYGETLGLRRLEGDDFAAVFDLAGVPLRVTEVPDHSPSPHPVLGWEVPDIGATVEALTAGGVAVNRYEGMGQDELRNLDVAGRPVEGGLLRRSRRQRPQPDAALLACPFEASLDAEARWWDHREGGR